MSPALASNQGWVATSQALRTTDFELRGKDLMTWGALFTALIGVVTPVTFEAIGTLYVGELVMVMVAIFSILVNMGRRSYWDRALLYPLICLALTFMGYILSDLINGTDAQNLFRGWARILTLMTDLIAFNYLFARKPIRFLSFCLGFSVGVVLTTSFSITFETFYKVGLAYPMTLTVFCLGAVLPLRARYVLISLVVTAFGAMHIVMDFRSMGLFCLITGAVVFAKALPYLKFRSIYVVVLACTALISGTLVAYSYLESNAAFSRRRLESNSSRRAQMEAAIYGIEKSPIVGNGSWSSGADVSAVMSSAFARQFGRRVRIGTELPGHSQILQVWQEAGLLGTTFFVFLFFRLCRGVFICVYRLRLSPIMPLTTFCCVLSGWDLFASPFAGYTRVTIAMAVTVVAILMRRQRVVSRRRAPVQVWSPAWHSAPLSRRA